MNKLLIFIAISFCFGCNITPNDSVDNNSTKPVGYIVKSDVVPEYLLSIEYKYDEEFYYEETLDSNGFPKSLKVIDKGNSYNFGYIYFEYNYDEGNRLKNVTSISYLEENKTYPKDTMSYTLQYKDNRASDTNSLYINWHSLLFNENNKILEFIADKITPLQDCMLNTYDKYGRVSSTVKFIHDGFYSKVIFEKYKYKSDDLIWTTREVHRMKVEHDNEEEFEDENGKIKINFEDFRKILIFPDSFDQKKEVLIQNRKVEPINVKQ